MKLTILNRPKNRWHIVAKNTYSAGLHASGHINGVAKKAVTRHHQSDDPSHNWAGMQTCVHTGV